MNRGCTIYVAKKQVLISFAATMKLICVFVFPYAKIRFSHDVAHIYHDVLNVWHVCMKTDTNLVCKHNLWVQNEKLFLFSKNFTALTQACIYSNVYGWKN